MRYKIDFMLSFGVCIVIMIFAEFWKWLDTRPEAFVYGDTIYHWVAAITNIVTNLAIGIAGAIVFYFMAQFLDKNKNFESYTDFRVDTLRLLYTHMEILSEIKQFEKLNRRERAGNWFLISNVPILVKAFKNIHSEEQKSQFKENLMKYFSNTSVQRLDNIMKDFEKYIISLDEKKDKKYFKGSKDLIEAITSMFDEGDFSLSFALYKIKEREEDKKAMLEELVKDYYLVLESTIELYEELEIFIDCIENKRLLTFLKMVD